MAKSASFMGTFGQLFWRTFFLIGALLALSLLIWYQGAKQWENEPRADQAAAQIQTIINVSRAALVAADSIMRPALLAELKQRENIQIRPREPGDKVEPLGNAGFNGVFQREARSRLGKSTTYASSVNGQPGLWISFPIERDEYWLQLPANRFDRVENSTWALWAAGALALSVLGAVAITSFINRPLKQLSYAASRIREGDFSQELGEESGTEEIRALNRGFNRMARSLEKIDQDRSVMLAGISHDLRTPLTRLRLETELSVTDSVSREHMIKDIEQVDEIIGKFLEYARPATADTETLSLRTLIENVESAYRGDDEIRLYVKRNYNAEINADPVELKRVLVNLIENSRRYGRSLSSNCAEIDISVRTTNSRVQIDIRDHGPGVPEEHLGSLTRPFFRGDAARTEVKGTGLGLAIVEKIIERMQGRLTLSNADGGGLLARIELKRV